MQAKAQRDLGCASLLLCCVLVACGGGGGSTSSNAPSPPPQTMPAEPEPAIIPRLSDGNHLGLIVGFEALSEAQQVRTDALLEANLAAGSEITRAQIDWAELEPAPGVYDRSVLLGALDDATRLGQQPFLTLSTLDTGGLTFPDDLLDDDGNLAEDRSLSDPLIIERLETFLAWLVPELAAYDVWGLAIANESSTLFEVFDQSEITAFLQAGIAAVNELDENLAVTVTFVGDTQSGSPVERFVADLVSDLDIVSFNYYCLSEELLATDRDRWESDFSTLEARAAGKPIFFQELGCPAGWSDTGGDTQDRPETLNASANLQAEFFSYALAEITGREAFRAATVFQLYDWSPELVDSFVTSLFDPEEPGNDLLIDRLSEWLGSTGLCRWADGSCRGSWEIYLDGVEEIAASR